MKCALPINSQYFALRFILKWYFIADKTSALTQYHEIISPLESVGSVDSGKSKSHTNLH